METYAEIFDKDPFELLDWLSQTFSISIPHKIESMEDMNEAAQLMLTLTGYYTYLCELLSYAKIAVRQAKRNQTKLEWEDCVDKQVAIDKWLDIVKQQYAALSRVVTVRTENNKELYMSN